MPHPIAAAARQGQSFWCEGLHREMLASGRLGQLVEAGVRGVRADPATHARAIARGREYERDLEALLRQGFFGRAACDELVRRDVQAAADLLLPVYTRTRKRDGYVTRAISPEAAHDARDALREARWLWRRIDRKNAMIEIPGTPEALAAVEQLVAGGVNVAVSLLFGREACAQAAEAWLAGLEERLARGARDLSDVACIAVLGVAAIDAAVEAALDRRLEAEPDAVARARIAALGGKAGLASARAILQRHAEAFSTARWARLARRGAQVQRLAWSGAATGRTPELYYLERLLAPDTVQIAPPETIEAFRRQGRVRPSLGQEAERAASTLADLEALEISVREATDGLLEEGLLGLAAAEDELALAVEHRRERADPFAGLHP